MTKDNVQRVISWLATGSHARSSYHFLLLTTRRLRYTCRIAVKPVYVSWVTLCCLWQRGNWR